MIVGDLAVCKHGERRTVLHESHPGFVVYQPARSRRRDGGILVLLGFAHIGLRGEHLHAPQLRGERSEDGCGQNSHRNEPRSEVVGGVGNRSLGSCRGARSASANPTARVAQRRGYANGADWPNVLLDTEIRGLAAVAQKEHRDHHDGGHDKRNERCDEGNEHRRAPIAVEACASRVPGPLRQAGARRAGTAPGPRRNRRASTAEPGRGTHRSGSPQGRAP